MRPFWTLTSAGFVATAITYGPARMGFGLFVPEFRDAFGLSTQTIGMISSAGFAGFLLGLLIAEAMLSRVGPRLPVAMGLIFATGGMALVGLAPSVWVLGPGVFLAMASAGFCWAPYNNAIHRCVKEAWRAPSLSAISTGTTFGILAAGSVAMAVAWGEGSWRMSWAAFALAGALGLGVNAFALRRVAGSPGDSPDPGWRVLLGGESLPLVILGLCLGVTSSVYISFAADFVREAGGLPGIPAGAMPALIFVIYGIFGITGLAADRARNAIGLLGLLRALLLASAASLVLIALAPGSWVGLVLSAGLQGLNVMMTSAVLAFWSDRLYPSLPTRSLTVVLLAAALGSMAAPALAGFLAEAATARVMFLSTALVPLGVLAGLRMRHIWEFPESELGQSA